MKNELFSWDLGSVADAIATAVFLAILVALYQVATASGFNVFTADWPLIGENMVNVAFTTAIVSTAKDFISTTEGSVLGITHKYEFDYQPKLLTLDHTRAKRPHFGA